MAIAEHSRAYGGGTSSSPYKMATLRTDGSGERRSIGKTVGGARGAAPHAESRGVDAACAAEARGFDKPALRGVLPAVLDMRQHVRRPGTVHEKHTCSGPAGSPEGEYR